MNTFGYCRVSTSAQADHGQSLKVQERQIGAYCTLHDLTLTRTLVDAGVSASKPLADRPAGQALLAALGNGDAIIATKLDRMFRSALDALAMLDLCRKRQIRLYLIDLGGDVTGDGIARLVFTILSAVAEAERDRTRERIREVKRDQRRRGRHLGGQRQFGYQIEDGQLIPDPAEQATLELIYQWHARGDSLRTMAAAATTRGTPLSRQSVYRALKAHKAT